MLQTVKDRATMAVIAQYRYDAFNRRVEKNVGGAITRYYLAGDQVLEERNGADAVTAYYTYGDYIDCRLTMDRGGARHYYHENRMYSTYVMTDNMGAVAERYAYTGYGVVTTYNAAYLFPQATSRLGNPYLFTGRELDSETLLYYYRARTYDPVQGRFKQLDPIGYEDGMNLYAYVSNKPTRRTDPSGLGDPLPKKCKVPPDTCPTLLSKMGLLSADFTKRLAEWNIDRRDIRGQRDPANYDPRSIRTHYDLLVYIARETWNCFQLAAVECRRQSPPVPVPQPVFDRIPDYPKPPCPPATPWYQVVGETVAAGARATGEAIRGTGQFVYEHPFQTGVVVVGGGIIVFDILTVPSGEGAIGVAMIAKATGG